MAVQLDQTTTDLIRRYAAARRTSPTLALRDLLERELGERLPLPDCGQRFQRIMEWLGPPDADPPVEIPKQYFDWLVGDAEDHGLTPALQRELKQSK